MDVRQRGVGFLRTQEVAVPDTRYAVKGPANVLRYSGWLRGLLPATSTAASTSGTTDCVPSDAWIEDNF
ncbi:hypothetical protein ABIE37_001550 [Arthrobacter bambusae]|uniref:Uncharacterized protein n=1 Tax=Arthrobacter bambusae TaxID=1338426 RepID=A0ABV2P4U1_9MICC